MIMKKSTKTEKRLFRPVRVSLVFKFALFTALTLIFSFSFAFYIIIRNQRDEVTNQLKEKSLFALAAIKTPVKSFLNNYYRIKRVQIESSKSEPPLRTKYRKRFNDLSKKITNNKKLLESTNTRIRKDSKMGIDNFYIVDNKGNLVYHRSIKKSGNYHKKIEAVGFHFNNVNPVIYYKPFLKPLSKKERKKRKLSLSEPEYNLARASIPVFGNSGTRAFYENLYYTLLHPNIQVRKKRTFELLMGSRKKFPHWRFRRKILKKTRKIFGSSDTFSGKYFSYVEKLLKKSYRQELINRAISKDVNLDFHFYLNRPNKKTKQFKKKMANVTEKLFFATSRQLINFRRWYGEYKERYRIYRRSPRSILPRPNSPNKVIRKWAREFTALLKNDSHVSWEKIKNYILKKIIKDKIPKNHDFFSRMDEKAVLQRIKRVMLRKGAYVDVPLPMAKLALAVKKQEQLGVIVLYLVTKEYSEKVERVSNSLADIGISVIIRFLLLSIILSGLFTKNLKLLGQGAYAIGQGDFTKRIRLTSSDEIGQLSDIINQMGHNLEKARIEQEQKIKLETEMMQAAEIQGALLPRDVKFNKFSRGDYYQAASLSGGDYFDYFPVSDNQIGWVVADVSGHGVGSAMLMAMTRILIREFGKSMRDPREALIQVSEILYQDTESNYFVTAFLAIFNTMDKSMAWASAGHNPTILFRAHSGPKLMKAGGIPLASMETEIFKEHVGFGKRTLKGDEIFIQYSDGVTEAMNHNNEQYELERLLKITRSVKGKNNILPKDIIDLIVKDLNNYSRGQPQRDDITLSAVRVHI